MSQKEYKEIDDIVDILVGSATSAKRDKVTIL